ncbi:unnamed protein product [Paramecium sonneborni]|uniref:Uncharacterized protein n=1 Tax=Paramecium sonneborni TaxID=65129 RepID=A0A8S1RM60_9CILI|nr:unnamed protein product [Paramecium sonneborni]
MTKIMIRQKWLLKSQCLFLNFWIDVEIYQSEKKQSSL